MISVSGAGIALVVSACCFVLSIFFGYRHLQKLSDDEETGNVRYALKAALWSVKKVKFWTLLGALILLVVLEKQFNITTVFQIAKDYNPFALAFFAIAQVILCSYFFYTVYAFLYNLLLAPFDELITKFLGFSIAPYKSLLKTFELHAGGAALYFILMLTAFAIDLRISSLSAEMLNQITQIMKIMIAQLPL